MKKYKSIIFVLASILSCCLSVWGNGLGSVVIFAITCGVLWTKTIIRRLNNSNKVSIQLKVESFMIGLGIFVCTLLLCGTFNGFGSLIVLGLLCATVI